MLTIPRDPIATQARIDRDLQSAKLKAIAQINYEIGQIRAQYITVAPGQETIYADKKAEAIAYVALPIEPPTLVDFPYLGAEVGITAPSAYELCQLWLYMNASLKILAAQLEGIRMTAIIQIEQSLTLEEVVAIKL